MSKLKKCSLHQKLRKKAYTLIRSFVVRATKSYQNGLITEVGESTNNIPKERRHLTKDHYLIQAIRRDEATYFINEKYFLKLSLKNIYIST